MKPVPSADTAHDHRAWVWRLLPDRLLSRVALVLLSALGMAHALTVVSLVHERNTLMQGMMSQYLARDVATALAILDRLTPPEREAWLQRLARPSYHYAFSAPIDIAGANTAPDDATTKALTALRSSLVSEVETARIGQPVSSSNDGHWHIPLHLEDGHTVVWLNVRPPDTWLSPSTTALLVLQLSLIAIATWWGVRLAIRPLEQMAEAANAAHQATELTNVLPMDLPSPSMPDGVGHRRVPSRWMPENGPHEARIAAKAFNAMQTRIEDQLRERLHILAAISHDLQTPITRLRLRAEQIDNASLRDKWMADLQAMQALVADGLAFARSAQAAQEPIQSLDLAALVDGLICDAVDAGHVAHWRGHLDGPIDTRVQALRRVLTNLIDNALKFAGEVDIEISTTGHTAAGLGHTFAITITVADRGPGIPEGELRRVLLPFYRVESSRNRNTGGTGLGLAIVQQLTLALGGHLTLRNRAGGGLAAHLHLPRSLAPPSHPPQN